MDSTLTLEKFVLNSNLDKIIDYVNSYDYYSFENIYLNKLENFENIYNSIFLDKKKQFYSNNSIHIETRIKKKTSQWMIERLLELDFEDSMNKYGFLNLINIHKKKNNLSDFKNNIK